MSTMIKQLAWITLMAMIGCTATPINLPQNPDAGGQDKNGNEYDGTGARDAGAADAYVVLDIMVDIWGPAPGGDAGAATDAPAGGDGWPYTGDGAALDMMPDQVLLDGFPFEAGYPDAGFLEAGYPDAGFLEAGYPDAVLDEAGPDEAGPDEAGQTDLVFLD